MLSPESFLALLSKYSPCNLDYPSKWHLWILLTWLAIAQMFLVPHMCCWSSWAKGKWSKTLIIRNCKQAGESSWGMASLELVHSTADKSWVLQTSTIILKWLWRSCPSWDILGLKVFQKEKYQSIRADTSSSRKLEFLRCGQAGYVCNTTTNCPCLHSHC